MIKKFLSFVALSVTLISPVFADEFVPLQYYEEEPVHYIPQTKIATPTRINSSVLSTRSADNSWGSDSKWESDECAIRQAIEDNDTHEVEDYKNSSSSKIDDKTIDDILSAMHSGNTWQALDIFDSETGTACGNSAFRDTVDNDPYYNEYYAGPGGRRPRNTMDDLEYAARSDKKSKELLDEIGSFKDGNQYKKPISGSGKDKATDIPSWANGKRPYIWENGKNYAQRLMDERYGKGNWKKSSQEYNKLKKHGDRGYE